MSQEDKAHINLAGEFLVAGELNRRRVAASITYGASKSADIFAFCRAKSRLARIEVKATDKKRWPVGNRALSDKSAEEGVFWVLVRLPDEDSAPEFFVFSGKELVALTRKLHGAYLGRYKVKHGVDFSGPGVPALDLREVGDYRDKWRTIVDYLK